MAAIRICGRCGFANAQEAVTCQQCGVTLEPLDFFTAGDAPLTLRQKFVHLAWIEIPFALTGTVISYIRGAHEPPAVLVSNVFSGWLSAMAIALFWLWIAGKVNRAKAKPESRRKQLARLIVIGFITPFVTSFGLAALVLGLLLYGMRLG